uniref:Uncharacterized protein n=1 Tax=Nelumbo nucifera TaxID=4432 RepID=A0A822XPE6_NELNU|nr:TPA_asm: hypothetical protein HUJ06_023385 [Nelumbo nucifera]
MDIFFYYFDKNALLIFNSIEEIGRAEQGLHCHLPYFDKNALLIFNPIEEIGRAEQGLHCHLPYFDKNALLIFNPIEEIGRAEQGLHCHLPSPNQPPARFAPTLFWDRFTSSLLPLVVFHTRSRQSVSIVGIFSYLFSYTATTKGADKNGPIAIGIISLFGWAYILALTFRAIVLLFVIWESFFFGGLSITTSAARVIYALSRDQGVPFSSIRRRVHPKHKVPANAVWLCATICILLGLPILKVNVVTAITFIGTIGWVGGYTKNFKPGPFYLGKARRPICLIAFLWICYTCSVFLLPTFYPITWNTFNYAPVALGVSLGLIMLWWFLDARKWFKGPVRNVDIPNGKV